MKQTTVSSKTFLAILAATCLVFPACQKDVSNGQNATAGSTDQATKATVTKSIIDLDLTENPFPDPIIVPCANGGLGEEIVPQGNVRQLSVVTVNGNHFTVKFQFTPQGVISIGQITGDIYQGTGVSELTQTGSFVNGTATVTSVWMFSNIGRAGAPNWKMIPTVHTTINANGTVTSSINKIVASCQ